MDAHHESTNTLACDTLDEEEYALMRGELARGAPRVFAVCGLTYDDDGTLLSGRVHGWGMAFADRTYVIARHGGMASCDDPSHVMRLFVDEPIALAWLSTAMPTESPSAEPMPGEPTAARHHASPLTARP
jgi:hypothetical protein